MKCHIVALLVLILGSSLTLAADAPLPKGVKVEKDIRYVADGDVSHLLDIYMPENNIGKARPLIVWIHGGGWMGGSKSEGPGAVIAAEGYIAASVEYRFSQKAKFPAQIQDCQAAIRWLRANCKKYNIDPDHVGVWGESAGGHLVALLGTSGGKKAFPMIGGNEEQSDRVQAVCDYYGPADFTTVMQQVEADKNVKNIFKFNTPQDPYSELIGVHLDDKEKAEAASPVHYVSKDAPPFLIMHGTKDALVPFAQSVELTEALKKAGVEVVLQPMPDAGHGGAVFWSDPVREQIKSFFARNLKGENVKVELIPEESLKGPGTRK